MAYTGAGRCSFDWVARGARRMHPQVGVKRHFQVVREPLLAALGVWEVPPQREPEVPHRILGEGCSFGTVAVMVEHSRVGSAAREARGWACYTGHRASKEQRD